MKTLLYLSFLIAFLLIVIASIYSYREKNYLWLILGLIASMGMSGGIVYFLLENVGRTIGLHQFDRNGLYVSIGVGCIVMVFGLLGYLIKRKGIPFLLVLLLGLIHVMGMFVVSTFFNLNPR